MSGIPVTRHALPADKVQAIRDRVIGATALGSSSEDTSRLAQPEDAEKLHQFLSDPAVHAPIYSLPRPLTAQTVKAFIVRHLGERARGEGLLFLRVSPEGDVVGYSDIQIWPEWGAGDLAGALRSDRQGRREGTRGIIASFDWMFEALGLELICATAALDNVRTAKMLDHLGFECKGEIVSVREDGTTRPSLVWEMTREDWLSREADLA
jgi:RimJ/RimL family protein N-acetyltransferase